MKQFSRFILKINTENDAFTPSANHEVARLLREVSKKIDTGCEMGKIMDLNGNSVGFFEFHIQGD